MPTKPKGLFEEVDAELSAPRKKRMRSLKIKLGILVASVFGLIVVAVMVGNALS